MENPKHSAPDNDLIEIIHYQAHQAHELKNMTFLRPGFCHVLRGTKVMQLANHHCISAAGSLSFLAPHEAIMMQHITSEGSFASSIVTFSPPILRDFNARYDELLQTAQEVNTTRQLASAPEQQAAWQKVVRSLSQKVHPKVVKYYFEGFLLQLALAGYRIRLDENNKSFAQRVTERLSQNPAVSLTLKEVANSLFISESTLLRRLKHEGVHYRQLKEDVYLSFAMDHVQTGQVPINQIALLAGYSSTSRFIARFKARFGLTPGALRKVMH